MAVRGEYNVVESAAGLLARIHLLARNYHTVRGHQCVFPLIEKIDNRRGTKK
jgi:hypothetical protein